MNYNPHIHLKITDDGKTSTSELLKQCEDKFRILSCWNNEELNRNFPPPKKPTTRYFSKTIEAEEKNKSYNELKNTQNYCTLRERLLMELQYFDDTGKHLDIENITLCAGSRGAGGGVPSVSLSVAGIVYVLSWHPSDASDCLRFRPAISLEPSPSFPSDLETRVAELEAFRIKVEKIINL